MCLHFIVTPASRGLVSARRLAGAANIAVKKHRGKFSFGHACSCVLLAKDATARAEFVSLDSSLLNGLSSAFRLVAKDAGGFTLEVLWPDYEEIEEITSESRVSVREFLTELAANRLRNAHRYIVGAVG